MLRRVLPCVGRLVVLTVAGAAVAWAQPQPARISDPTLADLARQAVAQVTSRAWPEALAAFDRAIARAIEIGDATVEVDLLRRVAFVQQNLKNLEGERAALDRALARAIAAGDRVSAGHVYGDLGLMAWRRGDSAGVRRQFGAAVESFAAAGERGLEASALRNLTFAQDMGNDERSRILERAFEVARQVDGPGLQGRILHQWGDVINLQGEYAQAIEKLEAARPLLDAGGTPSERANLATSLGRTWRLHGRSDRALEEYKRALALQEQANDLRGQAQTYDAMAVALSSVGQEREAAKMDEQAIALARRAGDLTAARLYEINLAAMRVDLGEHATAVTAMESLLASGVEARFEGRARTILAKAYSALGRLDNARLEADRAVDLLAPEAEFLIHALEARGRIRLAQADPMGALADARRALDTLDALRARAAPRDSMKQAFVDQHHRLVALAIDLSVQSADAAGGLAIAERARARAFLDVLATRNLEARASGLASSSAVSLSSAAGDVRARAGDLPSTVAVAAPSEKDIAALAGRLQSTLVCYWVGAAATYVWVVTPEGRIVARKVSVRSTRLESLVRTLASADVASKPGVEASLRALDELLVAPIRASLPRAEGSALTIIPHGPLFAVSFAALRDPRGRYLVESYELHYAPSAAVLGVTLDRASAAREGRDPSATAPIRRPLLVADPRPLPASNGRPLARLAGARREVQNVGKLLAGSDVATLVGSEATEARFRALARDRGVLHLATHGLADNERPFESFLALGRDGEDAERDGRLTAAEIYAMPIEADLVVLSACRTSSGGQTGDGLVGLTRAFLYAGAHAVMATLWDLADEPADRLLAEFYRQQRRGRSRAASLRTAQVVLIGALRRGEVRVKTAIGEVALPEHPALWSNLVLIGEP